MTERELKIQISFDTAIYISVNDEPELLKLIFNDRFMFVSIDGLPIELGYQDSRRLEHTDSHQYLVLERIIPPQI